MNSVNPALCVMLIGMNVIYYQKLFACYFLCVLRDFAVNKKSYIQ